MMIRIARMAVGFTYLLSSASALAQSIFDDPVDPNAYPTVVHLGMREQIISIKAGPEGPLYQVKALPGSTLGQPQLDTQAQKKTKIDARVDREILDYGYSG